MKLIKTKIVGRRVKIVGGREWFGRFSRNCRGYYDSGTLLYKHLSRAIRKERIDVEIAIILQLDFT